MRPFVQNGIIILYSYSAPLTLLFLLCHDLRPACRRADKFHEKNNLNLLTRGSWWVLTLAYPNLLGTDRLCCCNFLAHRRTGLAQWWEAFPLSQRSWVRRSLSAKCRGNACLGYSFPRPHSCGSHQHWVCPFFLIFLAQQQTIMWNKQTQWLDTQNLVEN
jgi:hypothetical protein